MKEFKVYLRMVMILLASYVIGIALLCGAFLIPDYCLHEHVVESAETLAHEGTYPKVGSLPSEILDNYTDALMVSIAGYEKSDRAVLTRAMGGYYPAYGHADPVATLKIYVQGLDDVQESQYARYWHGYLVVLRSLLAFMNYDGIRTMNNIGVIGTMLLLLAVIIRKQSYTLLMPLGGALFFLRPLAIMFSIQFSSVYYPLMISLILCIWFQKWFIEYERYLYLFLITGIAIAYLDLLTYPVASLGILLAAFLMLQKNTTWLTKTKQVIGAAISWGFGYFGMWSGKWLLSSMILRTNIFADAMNQAKMRASANASEAVFSRWMVFARNIGAGFWGILPAAGIIAVGLLLLLIWSNRKNLRNMVCNMIPYLLICLMPFAWYAVFANHSYIHIFFTYRALAAAVCAWSGMCVQGIRLKKKGDTQ